MAASASNAAENATTNVTPNTPAITAKRTVIVLGTCDTPSEPHVNPPNGQSPRSQSIAVHAAAAPRAVRTGRPGLRTSANTAPNKAIDEAVSSVKRTPSERAEEHDPRQRDPERHESEHEPEQEPLGGGRLPQRDEQERGREERERPGRDGREGERGQYAPDQGEDERDREPVLGQAQSRQNIRRLSAS